MILPAYCGDSLGSPGRSGWHVTEAESVAGNMQMKGRGKIRFCALALGGVLSLGSQSAWATYGGAVQLACSRSPVVAHATSTVALMPQCETVMQTVYQTVMVPEQLTVMQTQYKTVMKEEPYTVMKPVQETSFVTRRYTVAKPVYETATVQRRYTVQKPVVQTQQMERRYTVMKPVTRTSTTQREYTVMKPVVQTQKMERRYTVHKPVVRTSTVEKKYTVMKPVVQTQKMERRYTVMKPVQTTSMQERRYTVQKPVVQTSMVNESYNVLKPVQTTRQVVETAASFENRQTIVPGPVVLQTSVNGCTGCAQTVAVQSAPRVLNQTVMVQRPVIRDVIEPAMCRRRSLARCRFRHAAMWLRNAWSRFP